MTYVNFYDFPGLENGLTKFSYFPWPVGHTAHNLTQLTPMLNHQKSVNCESVTEVISNVTTVKTLI